MKSNLHVKRSLIVQSFAPLFLLLTIKYMDISLYLSLIIKFFDEIKQDFFLTLVKVFRNSAFGGLIVSTLGVIWIMLTIIIALGFKGIQTSGFKSSGELIKITDSETEGSAIFLVTYVLPLLTDSVSSLRELIVFILMLFMIIVLLINTKNFYHNPILVALKYKTYSFKFINPDEDVVDADAEYICITRDSNLSTQRTIKRKYIADNVFLIYND